MHNSNSLDLIDLLQIVIDKINAFIENANLMNSGLDMLAKNLIKNATLLAEEKNPFKMFPINKQEVNARIISALNNCIAKVDRLSEEYSKHTATLDEIKIACLSAKLEIKPEGHASPTPLENNKPS